MGQVSAVIIGGAFLYLIAQPLLESAANKVGNWRRSRTARRQVNRPD